MILTWQHDLEMLWPAMGSQKARFFCKNCWCRFSFYAPLNTIKAATEFVNTNYPENVMMFNQNRPGFLQEYWDSTIEKSPTWEDSEEYF